MWETWVRSLGREDPLEKEMAIHSSTIAWKIPWTDEPGRLQSMGSQRVGHDWATSLSLSKKSKLQNYFQYLPPIPLYRFLVVFSLFLIFFMKKITDLKTLPALILKAFLKKLKKSNNTLSTFLWLKKKLLYFPALSIHFLPFMCLTPDEFHSWWLVTVVM